MTPADRRRRALLDRAAALTADFRFRWAVPAAATDDGVTVSVHPAAADAGGVEHTALVSDLGPPSAALAGLAVAVTDLGTGREHRFRTDRFGLAVLAELSAGGDFRLAVRDDDPARPATAFVLGDRVIPDFAPTLAAADGPPPRQDFVPPTGPVRRLTLRENSDGDFVATLEVALDHPEWGGHRLARLRLVADDGLALLDVAVGLADKPGDPGVALGELNLDRADPAARHAAGRQPRPEVAPLPADRLLADLGPAARDLLRRCREATESPDGWAALDRAITALDAAADPPPAAVAADPPPPAPVPPPTPAPAPADDTRLELVRLRQLFEQKILRDQGQQQVIARLHDALKEAQADLVLKILRPVLLEMIRLHDDLADAARAADAAPAFGEFRQDVEDLLYRLGVERYECDGDRLDPARQKVRRAVPADDPAAVGRVVERLRPGFTYSGTVILRPEEVAALSKPPRDGGSQP